MTILIKKCPMKYSVKEAVATKEGFELWRYDDYLARPNNAELEFFQNLDTAVFYLQELLLQGPYPHPETIKSAWEFVKDFKRIEPQHE